MYRLELPSIRMMILLLAVCATMSSIHSQDLQALTKRPESPPSRHQFLPPPRAVHAEIFDNHWCEVTWLTGESIIYQMYNDGSAEDFALWQDAGSLNAVRFTPPGYPVQIVGARFNVGDGSFPGPFLGSCFTVCVFDDDGPGGLPGSLLDSVPVTVNNYHWVQAHGLNAVITSGDYYIAMLQTAVPPEAAPLGVDMTLPTYNRSYSKFQDNPWTLSAFQDFMIWALYSFDTTNFLIQPIAFNVARVIDFDPCGSFEEGGLIELSHQTDLIYMDLLAPADHRLLLYAIQAQYSSGDYSEYAFSNLAWYNMEIPVTIMMDLCSPVPGVEASITLTGKECPFEIYEIMVGHGEEGIVDDVWRGPYDLEVTAPGFASYQAYDVLLEEEDTLTIHLDCEKKSPRNLAIDAAGLATWDPPEPPAYWDEHNVWYYDSLVGTTQDTFFDLAVVGLEGLGQLCVQAVYPDGLSQKRCRNYDNSRIDGYPGVFPSPAVDQFTVTSDRTIETLELYDLTGRLIIRKTGVGSSVMMDIAGIRPGIYVVRISTGESISTRKIILVD